jgi:hypothetical protein
MFRGERKPMILATKLQAMWRTKALPQEPRSVFEKVVARGAGISLLVTSLLIFGSAVLAQGNAISERLPADTWAYVTWGGTASLKSVSGTNSILRLWNDPAFRASLENSIGTVSHNGGPAQKFGGLTPQQTARILSALENPAIIGFVNNPENSEGTDKSQDGFFLIYDATGKKELIETLRRERDAKMKDKPQVSSITIAGQTVQERVFATTTSYEALTDRYYISTESRHAMEELLARFGAEQASSASFTQAADFPVECRGVSANGILNLVVLPARLHTPSQMSNPGFDVHAFASSLHLNQIRAACGSVSFDKETMRTRGMVLGDTTQGSILNIFGNGRDSFMTMALTQRHSSFQVSVIDFAALYNSLFDAVSAALPSDKAPIIAAGVAFLSSSWGMPPDQVFSLFTGEFAQIQLDDVVDPSQSLYALTIHDPERLLHVLQHAWPGEQASMSQEGDVTYVTVTTKLPMQSANNSATPSVTYLAVTPDMLLGSKERAVLRDAVARVHDAGGATPPDGLTSDPDFQKARAVLPAKLIGLSYTNYANYNWQKLLANLNKQINDQMRQTAEINKKPAPTPVEIFQGFNPTILSRYLRLSIGGAWKDSNGIYFDSYIQ